MSDDHRHVEITLTYATDTRTATEILQELLRVLAAVPHNCEPSEIEAGVYEPIRGDA